MVDNFLLFTRVQIEWTWANRTLQSAQSFLQGLFGDSAAGIEFPPVEHVNWKLRVSLWQLFSVS